MQKNIPYPDSNNVREGPSNNIKKAHYDFLMNHSAQRPVFRFDQPKMFQRKPSFKMFQRKQKKVSETDVKICFISPQKSDIFKKHPSYRGEGSDLNSSVFTTKSRQASCTFQNKKPAKLNQFPFDLTRTRSMFMQLNNLSIKDEFRTPKNQRADKKSVATNNFKRLNISNIKIGEPEGKQTIKNNIDKNYNSLLHIDGAFSTLTTRFIDGDIQSQKVVFKPFQKNQKQIIKSKLLEQNRELRFDSEQVRCEVYKLEKICEKLESQKLEIEQSCKLFPQQTRSLQAQVQQLKTLCQNQTKQLARLSQQLAKKSSVVSILQSQLKHHRASTLILEDKLRQLQSNDNFKKLYFDLNQQFKYLAVEKDILKKILDQKNEQDHQVQKLESLNRKLTAKIKYLSNQVQTLEKQIPSPKGRKGKFPFKDNKVKISNQRKSVYIVDTFRVRQNHSKSVVLEKNLQIQDFHHLKNQSLQSVSNASSLEFSLELSPDKVNNGQVNRPSFFTNFKNNDMVNNFSRFHTVK